MPPPTTPSTAPTGDGPQFRKSLGVRHGVVIALANISPTVSVGIGLGLLASVAGPALPAAFLLAALPILAISGGYARMSFRDPNAGSAYIWVRRALGPWVGFMTGWVAIATNVLFISYSGQLAGKFTLGILAEAGIPAHPESLPTATMVGLVWTVLIVLSAVRGVEGATRVQGVLLGISAVIVVGVVTTAFVRGGAARVSLSWFDPGGFPDSLTLLTGTVLAAYCFWGWESTFNVAEENTDRRVAGRAGILAIVITLAFFLFSATGFLRALTPDQLADPTAGITELARSYYGTAGAVTALLSMLFAVVACMQSSLIVGARLTLAMGRDGVLGPSWSRLHPRYATPAVSTYRTAALALAFSLAGLVLGQLSAVILAVVNAVGILVSLMYGIGGIACVLTFRRELRASARDLLVLGVLPLLGGAALLGLGGLVGYQQWTSVDHIALDPENGRFLTAVPLGVLLLGVPAALWTRFGRRAAYFTQPAPPLPPESAPEPEPRAATATA